MFSKFNHEKFNRNKNIPRKSFKVKVWPCFRLFTKKLSVCSSNWFQPYQFVPKKKYINRKLCRLTKQFNADTSKISLLNRRKTQTKKALFIKHLTKILKSWDFVDGRMVGWRNVVVRLFASFWVADKQTFSQFVWLSVFHSVCLDFLLLASVLYISKSTLTF